MSGNYQQPNRALGMVPGMTPQPLTTTTTAGQPKKRPALGDAFTPQGVTPAPQVNIQQGATATPGNPAASPAPPRPAGAGTFGASNNLIGTQFSPTASGRTDTAGGYTQNAANQYFSSTTPQLGSVAPMNTAGAEAQFAKANQQVQGMQAPQYQAVAGTDMSRVRGQLDKADAAMGILPGMSAGANAVQTGGFGYSGDVGKVRAMGMAQLENVLNTTPDRATLSASAFKRMQEESQPQYEQDLRKTTALNAAMGRRGSGMLTQDLGTVQQRREEALARERGRLADDAAAQSLADAQAKLSSAQGFGDSLAGQDVNAGQLQLGYLNANNAASGAAFDRNLALYDRAVGGRMNLADAEANFAGTARRDALQERDAQTDAARYGNSLTMDQANASRTYGQDLYGIERDRYGNARDERDASYNAGMDAYNAGRQRFADASDYEQTWRGNDLTDRNELRGERDYQYGLSRDAQGDRVAQNRQQEAQFGNDWNRAADMTQMGYGAGQQVAGALGAQADRYGQQASDALSAGANLLGMYGQRRGMGPNVDPLPMEAGIDYGRGVDIPEQLPFGGGPIPMSSEIAKLLGRA